MPSCLLIRAYTILFNITIQIGPGWALLWPEDISALPELIPHGVQDGAEAGEMVEKEAKRLEVLKRRQERELNQLVHYELMRKALQVPRPDTTLLRTLLRPLASYGENV